MRVYKKRIMNGIAMCPFSAYLTWTFESRKWIHFCPQDPVSHNGLHHTVESTDLDGLDLVTWISRMHRNPMFFATFTVETFFPCNNMWQHWLVYIKTSLIDSHIFCNVDLSVCSDQFWRWRWQLDPRRPPEVLLFYHRGCYGITHDSVAFWGIIF